MRPSDAEPREILSPPAEGEPAWRRRVLALVLLLLGLFALQSTRATSEWRPDALIAPNFRADDQRPLLWLTATPEAFADASAAREALDAAAVSIAQGHTDTRVPFVPPPGEVSAWLDAHALYLLPVSEHEALRERLQDDALTRSVQGLRARLTSPLFGVSGADPRRDPIGVRPLLAPYLANTQRPWPSGASATAAGDLRSNDERNLLIQFHLQGEGLPALQAAVETTLGESSLVQAWVSPERTLATSQPTPRPKIWAVFAAVLLVVFALCRRLGPALLVGGALLMAWGVLRFAGPLFLVGYEQAPHWAVFAALSMACLVACVPRLFTRDAIGELTVFAMACVPLLALPYPGLRGLAGLGALLAGLLLAASSIPALRRALQSAFELPSQLETVPSRTTRILGAAVLALGLLGSAYLSGTIALVGVAPIDLSAEALAFRQAFFDRDLQIDVLHRGADANEALAKSAEDFQALAQLDGKLVARSEGPGAYLLAPSRLERRKVGLAGLRLRTRMQALHNLLEGQGFRSEAFSEFLQGAADVDVVPDARAALDGNLGPWISGRMDRNDAGATVRSSMHLNPGVLVPPLSDASGEAIEMQGPALARTQDEARAREGLWIAASFLMWWAALIRFVRGRSLMPSLAVAAVVASSFGLGLLGLIYEGVAYHALHLPALLLTAAFVGAQAHSLGLDRSQTSLSVLPTVIVCAVAGLCVAESDPLVHQWGLIALLGAAGGGALAHLALRPLLRSATGPTPSAEKDLQP